MTLVIKEIHINTIIDEESSSIHQVNHGNNLNNAISSAEKQRIIDSCVEEVLRIMEEKQER